MSHKPAKKIIIYTDGASRGNPGAAACAGILYNPDQEVLKEVAVALGVTTNNVAEYYGLLFSLQQALALGADEVEVFTDSELMTKQFSGEYKVRDENLKLLFLQIKHLKSFFKSLSVTHIPREKNKPADALCNRILDTGHFLV